MEEASKAAGHVKDEIDDATEELADMLPEECVALNAVVKPLASLLKDRTRGRQAAADTHKVRQVAGFGAMVAAAVLRRAAGDDASALADEIEGTIMQRRVFEPRSSVRRVLSLDAAGTNAMLSALLAQSSGSAQPKEANRQLDETNKRLDETNKRLEALLAKMAGGAQPSAEPSGGNDSGSNRSRHALESQKAHIQNELESQFLALEAMQADAEASEGDPLAKQLAVVECRRLQKQLEKTCANVQDVGQALGVVTRYFSILQNKLTEMNDKMDAIQTQVTQLYDAWRQVVGKPVLEELEELRIKRLLPHSQLRDSVHIPIEGLQAGDNGRFESSESNPTFDLLQKVEREFLHSEHKSVLLLSGLAGSGKTTFVSELELLIDTKYRDLVQESRKKPLILIKANLPTLSNPLSNLVHETLIMDYNLRDTQIQDLRELAREGKVEVIFLLDACALTPH